MTDATDARMGRLLPDGGVEFVRHLRHSPEKVWRALTESAHLADWFPADIVGERRAGAGIELTFWQQDLVDRDPRPLIRGLLHSDGCRVLNRVNGRPIRGTTSATCRPTSGGSSDGRATSWGSSGGPTTHGACRWPGGGVSPCWTSSLGPNGEPGSDGNRGQDPPWRRTSAPEYHLSTACRTSDLTAHLI